jgi:glycosyltransferase involved in cell wall biosynthesis
MCNVEKYIGECLDSILSNKVQDFEYEVIVADDGSTDGSLGVAKDFEARYDNVKVFSFANRGVSLTRKFLLNEAKGDFVWFVDADDYVDENVFVCIQKALDEEKTDVLIFDYRLKVGEDFLQGDFREEKESTYDNGIDCWLNCKLNVEVWNKVIRKSLLDETCFVDRRCYCEDLYFILRLFLKIQKVKIATFAAIITDA